MNSISSNFLNFLYKFRIIRVQNIICSILQCLLSSFGNRIYCNHWYCTCRTQFLHSNHTKNPKPHNNCTFANFQTYFPDCSHRETCYMRNRSGCKRHPLWYVNQIRIRKLTITFMTSPPAGNTISYLKLCHFTAYSNDCSSITVSTISRKNGCFTWARHKCMNI